MKMENQKYTLNEWIDCLNSYNSQYTQYGKYMPDTNYRKMQKNEFKRLTYRNTYQRLFNILIKMYKWKVPDSISVRTLEMGFIVRGSICIYQSKNGGIYGLPAIPQNLYNIYGDPTQVSVFGFNGYTELVDVFYPIDIPSGFTLDTTQKQKGYGVWVRDNDLEYPYINYIIEYATKISDKLVALNIATQRLKSPFTYAINDLELKDSVEKFIAKIEDNEDVIVRIKQQKMSGKTLTDSFNPINTAINPAVIDGIKNSILFDFNMFLETVGINTNPSPDKTQVVLTPELNSNNSIIDIEQDVRFLNRQKLCEDVKNILGVEMSVEKNIDEMENEIKKFKKEVAGDDNNIETKSTNTE